MPRLAIHHSLAAALCLVAAGAVAAQDAGVASLDHVEIVGKKREVSRWFQAESQHFVVYSSAQEDDVTELLDNLEKLDALLRIYTLPRGRTEPAEPKLTLYHLDRLSGLRQVRGRTPTHAVGLYSSCASGAQGFGVQLEHIPSLGDRQLDKSPLNDTLSNVFEAYARHFLERHTDIRGPASFVEGFAQYFSSVRFSRQQLVVGRPPTAIDAYLRLLDQGRVYSLAYEDVLQGDLDNARSVAGPLGVRLEFEAKSWLLTHYMFSSQQNRQRLNRYLVLTGAGTAPTAAFETAFGVKAADVGMLMWRYGLKGTEALRVDLPSLPAAQVSVHNLSREAGDVVMAQAVLASCPGGEVAQSLREKLADLAARAPGDVRVRLALGRAQIESGDPQAAVSGLEALLHEDSNAEASYLAGVARLRLSERSEGDARQAHLQAARRHLGDARELQPRSPEVAFALFELEAIATDRPDGDALRAIVATWRSARDIDALGRAAALVQAYAGRTEEARRTLDLLAQDVRNAATMRWAGQWRSRLDEGATRGDLLEEMRRLRGLDAAIEQWTVDKDSALQEVKLAHGLQASQHLAQKAQASGGMRPAQNSK